MPLQDSSRHRWPLIVFATACVALVSPSETAFSQNRLTLLLVVSAARPETNLSLGDVREIFLRQKTAWPSGEAIVPVFPPETVPHYKNAFLVYTLDTSPREYVRRLQVRNSRGAIRSVPAQYADMKETLRALKQPGAIVLIPAIDTAPFRQYLKVLRVDHKAPADPDYPLAFAQ